MDGDAFGVISSDDDVYSLLEEGSSIAGENPEGIKPADTKPAPTTPAPIAKATPAAVPDDNFDPLEEGALEEESTEGEPKLPRSKEKPAPVSKEGQAAEEEKPEGENQYAALAKDFAKIGILPEFGEDDEIPDTEEALKETLINSHKTAANNWINSIVGRYGEEGTEMFKAVFVNGVAPEEYLKKWAAYTSVADLDTTNVDNQESIVRQYYLKSGLTAEKVEAKIKKLKDTMDLQEEAETFHPLLVANEKKELDSISKRAEDQKREELRSFNVNAASISKILNEKLKTKDFDGIPLSDKMVAEITDELSAPKWMLNGKLLTDFDKWYLEVQKPENHAEKIKMWLLKKMNDKDPTLSGIKKKAISEESSALFSSVKRTNSHQTGGKNTPKDKIAFI